MPRKEGARDFRPGPLSRRFSRVPHETIARMYSKDLPLWAAAYLMTLSHCWEVDGRLYASNPREDTARALGVSTDSVSKAIATCKRKGLLKLAEGGAKGRSAVYLMDPWQGGRKDGTPGLPPFANAETPALPPKSANDGTQELPPLEIGGTPGLPPMQDDSGPDAVSDGDSVQRWNPRTSTTAGTPGLPPIRTQKSSYITGLFGEDSGDDGRPGVSPTQQDAPETVGVSADGGEQAPAKGAASYPITDLRPIERRSGSLLDMFSGGERHER